MDQLIESLPLQTSATLCVIYTEGDNDNVCTKGQVIKANEKGWKVMRGYEFWNSGPDHYRADYKEYEGSDPSGIEVITLINDKKIPIYNLNGIKLKQLQKGINIVGGKKVVVK
jgi:hypothetical protein